MGNRNTNLRHADPRLAAAGAVFRAGYHFAGCDPVIVHADTPLDAAAKRASAIMLDRLAAARRAERNAAAARAYRAPRRARVVRVLRSRARARRSRPIAIASPPTSADDSDGGEPPSPPPRPSGAIGGPL